MCVRKVLGASIWSLLSKISLDFGLVFLLAVVVAIPIAHWLVGEWMSAFAYRTHVGLGIYALAIGSLALVILLTLTLHFTRLSRVNPAVILRDD